jgi:penicillin-binding protein 2
MITFFKRLFSKNIRYTDIDPDEIFLDAQNIPQFDTHQFEGRIEKPISRQVFIGFGFVLCVIASIYIYALWNLQITEGDVYAKRSENNRLSGTILFAHRGLILDRNNVPLAWNTVNTKHPDFADRAYATSSGLSTIVGYIKYPAKDSSGFYYQKKYTPKDGLEETYDAQLAGINGLHLIETDTRNKVTSESIVEPPQDGDNVTLSIDAGMQKEMYDAMIEYSTKAGYQGGAGVVMDIYTGEILAMVSFPEYDSNVLTDGSDTEKIGAYLHDTNNPFLNRVVGGIYTPGSIVKPYIAMGVLNEHIIDPNTQILSTGALTVPNPYNPDKPSIFKDWKAHGLVDLRHAIAVSSNVYFFQVGGGFGNQKGLGITNIEKYMRMFGFGNKTGIKTDGEQNGVIPNPTWKKNLFGKDEEWRLGDTYNTSIGQYGVQVTPLQVVRAVASIANGGNLISPSMIKSDGLTQVHTTPIPLDARYFTIVKEGMRLTVTEGTSKVLGIPQIAVAAKSGTAELGVNKSRVNSWITGFFPYEKPRYAFAIVMEKGVANNQVGAALVMKKVLDWIVIHRPEYYTVQ